MRTEQPGTAFVDRANGSSIGYRRPDQSVDVLHRLDLRLKDSHLTFTIPLAAVSSCRSTVYNTVVLGQVLKTRGTFCGSQRQKTAVGMRRSLTPIRRKT